MCPAQDAGCSFSVATPGSMIPAPDTGDGPMRIHHPGEYRMRHGVAGMLLATSAIASAAAAACTGPYADLQSYAGKYLAEPTDLLSAAPVVTRLQHLSATERLHLRRNLSVSGPVELDACHLIVSGNAPHRGTEEDAIVDFDLASGTLIAAIHTRGRTDVYLITEAPSATPDWQALPMTVQAWAVRADMGFPEQLPPQLVQPRSVHLHAPPPTAEGETPAPPVSIQSDVQPSRAQTEAIQRATGNAADCGHPGEACYSLSLADMDDDGRPDLLVLYNPASAMGDCGTMGCGGIIVMATADGYASTAIGLPAFNELGVLPSVHQGMHDLQFDRYSPPWRWNGSQYQIDETGLPASAAMPWQLHDTGGFLVASVAPIDSVIDSISLYCNQGVPVLDVQMKMALAAAAPTMTWVFNGWTLNLPLSPTGSERTRWLVNLSNSDLPLWLARQGNTDVTRELARLVTESYLRLDGAGQGSVSLDRSAAATQRALATCYRY